MLLYHMRISNWNCSYYIEEALPEGYKVFCFYCTETFTSKTSLIVHRESKHGIENTNYPLYPCDVCQYVTQNSNTRSKLHRQYHNLTTVYKCNRCMFLAPTYGGMKCHLRKTHCTIEHAVMIEDGVSTSFSECESAQWNLCLLLISLQPGMEWKV